MSGITNLKDLINSMNPILNEGEYVFISTKDINQINRNDTICEVKEKEGVTAVILRKQADQLKLPYNEVMAWITLSVHSALNAVGLTAAFSKALAEQDISCNVMAGYYHDHIFVQYEDKTRALEALQNLSESIKS